MGRPAANLDLQALLDLAERGEKAPAIASELGVSAPTIRKRIQELQENQGLILQYRAIQSIQLTSIQARILEAITPEKIEQAPLKDLVQSYKILKEKECLIEGKPSEIKGLIAHLLFLEKQDQALKTGQPVPQAIDAEFTDSCGEEGEEEEATPSQLAKTLAQLDDSRF